MGKLELTEFFRAAERRFERLRPEEGAFIQVLIQGKVFELRFLKAEHAEAVTRYLIVPVLKEHREPDVIIYYWYDDLSSYLPPGIKNETAVWLSRDETGEMCITSEQGISGIDYTRNVYYHCREPLDDTDCNIHGHSLVSSFGKWAIRNSYILMHSACVGMNGKGIIISARGGGGKSTLAISCLLGGFDFVSDDYIMVNQDGPMKAMPLYSVIGINQDMAGILKPDMPVLRTEPKRNNKLYLDASAYDIKNELPVQAIIYPNPCNSDEPEIIPASPGLVIPKIIDTTAKNMMVFRDPEPYKIMSKRLIGLPVYEFRLTGDLFKNRDRLKDFITKEL